MLLLAGACNEEQIRDECKDFIIYYADLHRYRNKFFYVKREKLAIFHKNLIVPSNKNCSKGKKNVEY